MASGEININRVERAVQRARLKRWGLWLSASIFVAAALAGAFWFARNGGPAGAAALSLAVSDSDWSMGSGATKAVLVEYSDFQCPACAAYYPLVERLRAEFGGQLLFVYRHFPLYTIHAQADLASRAAEAAGRQGKFWEMYGLIFERQSEWSRAQDAESLFSGYADTLGLDRGKFIGDLASKEVKAKVERDFQSGLSSGVDATPTFFLNGQKIQNPRSYEEISQLIQKVLADGQ